MATNFTDSLNFDFELFTFLDGLFLIDFFLLSLGKLFLGDVMLGEEKLSPLPQLSFI